MTDKKTRKASVPLGSLQKERLRGGHRRSPWRHVLSPSRTWSPVGGCSASKFRGGAETVHWPFLPVFGAWVDSQPSLSCGGMLLEARLFPGYGSVPHSGWSSLLLGRKEGWERSHVPGWGRGSSTCQGKRELEGELEGQGGSETGRQREESVGQVRGLREVLQLVFKGLGCGKYLTWSEPT